MFKTGRRLKNRRASSAVGEHSTPARSGSFFGTMFRKKRLDSAAGMFLRDLQAQNQNVHKRGYPLACNSTPAQLDIDRDIKALCKINTEGGKFKQRVTVSEDEEKYLDCWCYVTHRSVCIYQHEDDSDPVTFMNFKKEPGYPKTLFLSQLYDIKYDLLNEDQNEVELVFYRKRSQSLKSFFFKFQNNSDATEWLRQLLLVLKALILFYTIGINKMLDKVKTQGISEEFDSQNFVSFGPVERPKVVMMLNRAKIVLDLTSLVFRFYSREVAEAISVLLEVNSLQHSPEDLSFWKNKREEILADLEAEEAQAKHNFRDPEEPTLEQIREEVIATQLQDKGCAPQ